MVDDREDTQPGFATRAVHGGGSTGAPTVETVERRVASLEGGTAAVAVASGATLILAAFQPLMRPGDQAIVAVELDPATRRALAAAFPGFGWEVRVAATDDIGAFERAVSPKTQAILAATVTGSGEVADIEALAQLAKRAGVPLLLDNTIATPALCRPLAFGADVVIHTDARFLAGEAGTTGFIVDGGRFNWQAARRYPALAGDAVGNFAYAAAVRALAGSKPGAPETAALAAGLETLPLRMARHAETAAAIADYLAGHSRVAAVAHAGVAGDRHHMLAAQYCPAGPGAVVAFTMDGTRAAAFPERLRLIAPEMAVRSALSSLVRQEEGRPGEFRLFVGLEDAPDLIGDLDQALAEG